MTPTSKQLPRYCLITVGATVGFNDLIKEAIHPDFWHDLNSRGFTALRIQCGPDIESATKRLATLENNKPRGMTVDVFEVSRNLMTEEMTLCKPSRGQRHQGLVISHAGTGTILDAWKLSLPIIVVPNTRLLDDHQTEMAKHLAKEGYATMSTACRHDLQEAMDKNELLWEENKTRWPPHDPGRQDSTRISIWDISPADVKKEENVHMLHD